MEIKSNLLLTAADVGFKFHINRDEEATEPISLDQPKPMLRRGDREMTTWPTNADGSNKKFGEMTAAERKAVLAASVTRIKAMDRSTFEKIVAKSVEA